MLSGMLVVVFRIEKTAMLHAILLQPEFAENFIAALLVRNVNMEEDLCDQLFNHTELRSERHPQRTWALFTTGQWVEFLDELWMGH